MPDNPKALPAGPFTLPDYRVLEISGRDAAAFAHAQFMNDVAGLAPGHWQWNGWLTPKGRVVALFALLKLDAERLWLLLPDVDPAGLVPQLQRFVFRSKVILRARPDCAVTGGFAAPAHARGAVIHSLHGVDVEHLELDLGGSGGPRTLWIDAAVTDAADDAAPLPAETRESLDWKAFDIRHGLPRLPPSQAEQWTPQMLSLDRLRAFSVKKGCYPGQEIVARTYFLGQAKRGLALFEADGEVDAGTEVRGDDLALGTVVSSATHGGESLVLAVLPLERHTGTSLRAGDVALRARTTLDGMAR